MKEGAVMPRIIEENLLNGAPSAKVDTGFARKRRECARPAF
jgi:hypothetical protein